MVVLAGLIAFRFVPLVDCPQCYGSGEYGGVKGDPDECSHCDGKGGVSLYMKYVRRPDKPPERLYPFWKRPLWYER